MAARVPVDVMLVCPECGRTYPAGRVCTEDGARLLDASGEADGLGAPRGNYIGNVAYYAFGKSSARWLVNIGSFSQFVNDDCGS